jgi:septum formation protein
MQSIRVFLASQSPRRKALLETMGITPIVVTADPEIDAEALEQPLGSEDPLGYVQRIALLKKEQGLVGVKRFFSEDSRAGHDLLIAADTTVALNGEILGKPHDTVHATEMLKKLSDKTHQVHTAIAMTRLDQSKQMSRVVSSDVTFAPLPNDWIAHYVRSQEPLDKAGAYGIQGIAQAMIPSICGSYSAIVGLPMHETWQLLKALGYR